MRSSLRSIRVVLIAIATARFSVGTFVEVHVSLIATSGVIRMHLPLHSHWLSTVASAHRVLGSGAGGQVLLVLHLVVLAGAQGAVVQGHQNGLAHGTISVLTIGVLLHTHNDRVSVSHPGVSYLRDVLKALSGLVDLVGGSSVDLVYLFSGGRPPSTSRLSFLLHFIYFNMGL